MAKYKVLDAYDNQNPIGVFFEGAEMTDATKRELQYTSPNNNWQLVAEGKFTIAFGGEFKGGTIESLTWLSFARAEAFTITGLELNAKTANALITGDHTFDDFIYQALSGKDKLTGSSAVSSYLNGYAGDDKIVGGNQSDTIIGGKGNDTLTGKGGVDHFDFWSPKFGKDVITDFDAVGSDGSQDYLGADPNDVKSVTKSGHDTLIQFFDGSQILLLDVGYRQITTEDFGIS